MIDRRRVLAAGAAACLYQRTASAIAPSRPLFDQGPLNGNPVARSFERTPPDTVIPTTLLAGTDGQHRLGELTGKVRILSLWAEWCVPCLVEARDLARLRAQLAGPGFDILAVLTAGRAGLSAVAAHDALARIGAGDLPTWVEPKNGRAIGEALAVQQPPHISLPCNLILDRAGRIRGRSIGNGWAAGNAGDGSHWSTPDGLAFVRALHDGALRDA